MGGLPAARVARPEDYPSRPVTIIVPYGPGGGVSINARALQAYYGKALGTCIIVEHREGANSGGELTPFGAKIVRCRQPSGVPPVIAVLLAKQPDRGWLFKLYCFTSAGRWSAVRLTRHCRGSEISLAGDPKRRYDASLVRPQT